MKTIKTVAAAALLSTSFIVPTAPAFAGVTLLDSPSPAGADATTLAAMQSQCDTLAAARDTGNGDIWTGEVNESTITANPTPVSGPTEVSSHSITDAIGEPDGAGTFTPGHREILGNPYRNGGSVNMFGTQQAVGGYYSASSYDFEGQFETTYSYSFSCDISQQVYHASSVIPGHPVEGFYVNNGTNPSGNEGSCQGLSPANPHWGSDLGNCIWNETGPAVDDETVPESWDQAALVGSEAGTPVDQAQTDTLLAHEDFGEGFSTSETLLIGQVVVCISPKKLPGTWTKQNGYTGANCTTSWYNGGATVGVPNLNTGSHNWVTVPVI